MASKAGNKRKKLLLITSSGGGGHLQAAKAKAVNALAEDPDTIVIQKDIMLDCLGKRFGKGFAYLWNFSQKKGNLTLLSFLSKNIPTADILFYPHIFFRILYAIIRNDVDQVIDTQPIGTSAIIRAIKWARRITNKRLKLEKIVTELPTDKVLHFFKPIKGISHKNHDYIKLISTIPLLHENQTPEAFWRKNCGLSEKEVCYEGFPLRPTFARYENQERQTNERMEIQIKVTSPEEKLFISNTIKKGNLHSEIYRDKVAIHIESNDKVATILLGSQPAEEATLNYVKSYIEMMRRAGNRERHLLFVFCNQHAEHKNTLLKRMHDLVQKTPDYPSNLNVIPMCFQDDEVIAPLYYRSDATFTRSGGLTSMELMSVAQGQIWIHSEVRHGTIDGEKLCKGMPIWERGNAIYLKEKKGARFITPDTFFEACESFFIPERATANSHCMFL